MAYYLPVMAPVAYYLPVMASMAYYLPVMAPWRTTCRLWPPSRTNRVSTAASHPVLTVCGSGTPHPALPCFIGSVRQSVRVSPTDGHFVRTLRSRTDPSTPTGSQANPHRKRPEVLGAGQGAIGTVRASPAHANVDISHLPLDFLRLKRPFLLKLTHRADLHLIAALSCQFHGRFTLPVSLRKHRDALSLVLARCPEQFLPFQQVSRPAKKGVQSPLRQVCHAQTV